MNDTPSDDKPEPKRNEFVAWALLREKQLRWVEMMIEFGVLVRRFSEEHNRATREHVRQADAEGRKNLEEGLLVLLDIVPDLWKKLTQKASRAGLMRIVANGRYASFVFARNDETDQ